MCPGDMDVFSFEAEMQYFLQVDEDSDRLVTDAVQQDPDSVHDEREAPKLHKGSRNMLLNAMDSDKDE